MPEMTLNEYQKEAFKTAIYPGRRTFMGVLYTAMGLNGEAGEVAEKVKKLMREYPEILHHSALHLLYAQFSHEDKSAYGFTKKHSGMFQKTSNKGSEYPAGKHEEILKELGDVLWYLALLADEWGFTLEDVAKANVEKLQSRQERNTLHGEGDDR